MPRGLSILEILVGLTILAVAIIPIALIFQSAAPQIDLDQDYITALFIAQKVIEEFRYSLHLNPKNKIEYTTPVKALKKFSIAVEKKPLENELYLVDVNIRWVDKKEEDREIKLSTLVSTRFELRSYVGLKSVFDEE